MSTADTSRRRMNVTFDSFHTTFVYNRAADSWQWHMDNDSSGVRRPFARVTLTRQ